MRIDPSYQGWNRQVLAEKFGPQWVTLKAEDIRPGCIAHVVRHNDRESEGMPPTEIVGPVLAMYEREEGVFLQIPGAEIIGLPKGTEVEVILA